MFMRRYKDTRYKISLEKTGLPSGTLTLCFFTDLHNCCSPEETSRIEAILQRNRPDLILCGGDSIVAKPGCSVTPAADFLTHLAGKWAASHDDDDPAGNIYLAMGNHEYRTRIYPDVYGDMYPRFVHALEQSGRLVLLQNEVREFTVHGLPVSICGFSMDRRYYGRIRHEQLPCSALTEAFRTGQNPGTPPSDRITLLLAHSPSGMDAYLEWGADLTLCGHYHGGIVRFGKHSGLISPDLSLFTGKAYGLFQKDEKSVIVSSGCGEHTIPVRIHNPREIVTAEIHVNDHPHP